MLRKNVQRNELEAVNFQARSMQDLIFSCIMSEIP